MGGLGGERGGALFSVGGRLVWRVVAGIRRGVSGKHGESSAGVRIFALKVGGGS